MKHASLIDATDLDARAVSLSGSLVEVDRLVSIQVSGTFGAGVETAEQLDAALEGLREACARYIGRGKKVVAQ